MRRFWPVATQQPGAIAGDTCRAAHPAIAPSPTACASPSPGITGCWVRWTSVLGKWRHERGSRATRDWAVASVGKLSAGLGPFAAVGQLSADDSIQLRPSGVAARALPRWTAVGAGG